MSESMIDKACAILRATHDGNDLAPEHLSIVQAAVNRGLSETGEVAFEKLYQDVLAGYRKPWFHGIEHLTLDPEGYVYWKSQQVEHYNMPWAGSEEARPQAEELAERCRTLEGRGLPVNTTTIVWRWPESLNAVPA